MTPNEYALQKQKRFQGAMAGLVMDTRFAEFIDTLRNDRENVIRNLIDTNVAGNERLTLAAIGELSCYQGIIDLFDEFRKRGAPESSL